MLHPPNNYSNKINYLISGTFFCINRKYKHQRIQCISWILHINNICISHMKQFFTKGFIIISNVIKLTMIKRFELIILLTRHKAVQNRSVYPLQRWLLPDYG